MKFQTIALIVMVATLACPTESHHLLRSLIQKKLEALPSVLSAIGGLKSSLTSVKSVGSEASIRFAGRVDTVAAPALELHTVAVPSPVVRVDTVAAPAPIVHVHPAPAPVVHVHPAPAPVVHVHPAAAPVVHVHSVPEIQVYAPYYSHYETPIHYKEVHPVHYTNTGHSASESLYFDGQVHRSALGDAYSGSVKTTGTVGLDIRVEDEAEASSSGSATAEFSYASAY